jgi:methylphosphotriester-DNA--protein-cysteine methyltransferase
MTPVAIRKHHQSVEKIVRLLKDQIEQSAQLNKAFKELYRHQYAIMKMFKK